MVSERERLKQSLTDRLRRFLAGDTKAVIDTARSEVTLAMNTQADSADYVDVVTLLGQLRLCREGLLRPGQTPPDLRETALMLAPVYRATPNTFPMLLLVTVGLIAGLPKYDKPERLFGKAVNLANYGLTRRDVNALHQAISLLKEALEAATPDYPDRSAMFTNICSYWLGIFELTGDRNALEEAVRAGHDSVAIPALPQHRSMALFNLGIALRWRYDQDGPADDLDTAIALFEESIPLTPREDIEWPVRYHSLGYALGMRYHAGGRPEDLDRAIGSARLAVEAMGPHRPKRAEYLSDLGYLHWCRYELIHDRTDVAEAARLLKVAVATLEDEQRREIAAAYLRAAEAEQG